MPLKEVLEQEEMLFGPKGARNDDDELDMGDAYWVQISDDGQICAVADKQNNEFKIFEYNVNGDGRFTVQKTISASDVNNNTAVIDIKPRTHTCLYNKDGTITEYDYDSDTETALFSGSSSDGAAMYWPRDRSKIKYAESSTSTVHIKNRDGTTSQQTTLDYEINKPTFSYRPGISKIIASGPDDSFYLYNTSGGSLGKLETTSCVHIYSRGPFTTLGVEKEGSWVLETSGVTHTMFPTRSNVITIRDPPGREGYKFVGTYKFSVYEFAQQRLTGPPVEQPNDSYVWAGISNKKWPITQNTGERVTITAYASTSNTEFYIQVPEVYEQAGFPTPFRTESTQFSPTLIETVKESGTQTAQFTLPPGIQRCFVGVRNTNGNNQDIKVIVNRNQP